MPVIKGNNKDNRLVGDSDVFGVENKMYGFGGNDTLHGGFQADNYIWGGTGNDTIEGGVRINHLYGEDGDDILRSFYDGTDNRLFGGSGADQLIGGDGGSYMNGGSGADIMTGGAAGDVYIVDSVKDQVIETWVPEFDNQYDPIDTVQAIASFALSAEARIEVLETLNAVGTKSINLYGNAFGQTIKGNAGTNTLDGKGGNDVLIGGAGADKLLGGTGSDTASYKTSTSGVTISLAKPSINTGDAKGDTYSSIETLVGSRFADKITGDATANTISGGAGNDVIAGANGRDILKGDAGNDTLRGGADNDVLVGGSGKDTFVFNTALSSINIDTITDFRVVDDTIHLENSIFSKLSGTGVLQTTQFVTNVAGVATDKSHRIIYESDTGKLFYDADGNGAGAAVQFAKLGANLALTNADFFII